MTNYEKIKEACIKANPEIVLGEHEHFAGPDNPPEIETELRPIQLADVLLALFQKTRILIDNDARAGFVEITVNHISREAEHCGWYLPKTLEGQDKPTIDFLYKLLY